jgi:hypothetical protein
MTRIVALSLLETRDDGFFREGHIDPLIVGNVVAGHLIGRPAVGAGQLHKPSPVLQFSLHHCF